MALKPWPTFPAALFTPLPISTNPFVYSGAVACESLGGLVARAGATTEAAGIFALAPAGSALVAVIGFVRVIGVAGDDLAAFAVAVEAMPFAAAGFNRMARKNRKLRA